MSSSFWPALIHEEGAGRLETSHNAPIFRLADLKQSIQSSAMLGRKKQPRRLPTFRASEERYKMIPYATRSPS
jgi:hypothetical protein